MNEVKIIQQIFYNSCLNSIASLLCLKHSVKVFNNQNIGFSKRQNLAFIINIVENILEDLEDIPKTCLFSMKFWRQFPSQILSLLKFNKF